MTDEYIEQTRKYYALDLAMRNIEEALEIAKENVADPEAQTLLARAYYKVKDTRDAAGRNARKMARRA